MVSVGPNFAREDFKFIVWEWWFYAKTNWVWKVAKWVFNVFLNLYHHLIGEGTCISIHTSLIHN